MKRNHTHTHKKKVLMKVDLPFLVKKGFATSPQQPGFFVWRTLELKENDFTE